MPKTSRNNVLTERWMNYSEMYKIDDQMIDDSIFVDIKHLNNTLRHDRNISLKGCDILPAPVSIGSDSGTIYQLQSFYV